MSSLIVNSLWLIAVDPHRGGSISLRPANRVRTGRCAALQRWVCADAVLGLRRES